MNVFNLGSLVVKILLKYKYGKLNGFDAGMELYDFASKWGNDVFDQRKAERYFADMADEIAKSCNKILERSKLSDDDKEQVIEAVSNSLTKTGFSESLVFDIKRDSSQLEKIMISRGKEDIDGFSEEQMGYYDSLVSYVSNVLIETFTKSPAFSDERNEYSMALAEEMYKALLRVLRYVEKISETTNDLPDQYKRFENEYRRCIVNACDRIHIFGAETIDSSLKTYSLNTAYVQLEVTYPDGNNQDIEVSDILNNRKNVWLSGEAGSGKTTCLHWMAISAAKGVDIKGINENLVPIIIELRSLKMGDLSLRNCIKKFMKDSSYEMPNGWLENKRDGGNILYLVDGVDEISAEDRNTVFEWIRGLDAENKCYKIFTSRPQVKERPDIDGLCDVRMLPMKHNKIEQFIRYWHQAVLVENLKQDKEDVNARQRNLLHLLKKNESLRMLASTPLLCAMIACLHYKTGMAIPSNKRDLYEACCKMLINSRNEEQRISNRGIVMPYESQKFILAKLALHMMRNKNEVLITIKRSDAIEYLNTILHDMNATDIKSDKFLDYVLERTGLLKEEGGPTIKDKEISYVHRTFQEYLCACEISREVEWGYLMSKIGDELWNEIISIAIGFANNKTASLIVKEALRKEANSGEIKYVFCALEYLAGALEVEEDIRDEVEVRLSALIPPKTEDIERIAQAGEIAVNYLRCKTNYHIIDRRNCILTLKNIRSIQALNTALEYLNADYLNYATQEEFQLVLSFVAMFPGQILRENNVPHVICDYLVKKAKKNGILIVPADLIRVMRMMGKVDIDRILALGISKMRILDYSDQVSFRIKTGTKKGSQEKKESLEEILGGITELSIQGDFNDLKLLQNFKNLRSLAIWNYNSDFDLLTIGEQRNLYGVSDFKLFTSNKDVYISGSYMEYLYNCNELTIGLLENDSKLEFADINMFANLKIMTVIAEDAFDYDYSQAGFLEALNVYGTYCSYTDESFKKKYGSCAVVHEVNDITRFFREIFEDGHRFR